MPKTKKLQIPISAEEEKMIKLVAKIYQVPAAEWVRNTILRAAHRELFDASMADSQTVAQLSKLNAPVGTVETMKTESLKGRRKLS